MRSKYQALIKRAKDRNLSHSLSYEDFKTIKRSDCAYCGVSDLFIEYYCQVMAINTPWISIDRKDNSKGYSRDNCVPACFLCNKIKGSFFTYEEMLEIGEKYVRPKLKFFEQDMLDAYEEWCEKNIYVGSDFEDWDHGDEE